VPSLQSIPFESWTHPTSTMSTEQVPTSLPFVDGRKAVQTVQHPVAPLTATEITESSRLIRECWPSNTNLHFKVITLQEPSKAELLPYLEAARQGKRTAPIERRSFVVYYIRNTVSSTWRCARSGLVLELMIYCIG
jgi:primary-amine oxidase